MSFLLKKIITTAICGMYGLCSSDQNKRSFHRTATWSRLKDHTTEVTYTSFCSHLWFSSWQPHLSPGAGSVIPEVTTGDPCFTSCSLHGKNVLWAVGGDLWCWLLSKCWKDLQVEGKLVECPRKPCLCSGWGKTQLSVLFLVMNTGNSSLVDTLLSSLYRLQEPKKTQNNECSGC